VSWYLNLGARQIFLFFDNPYDFAIGEMLQQPRIHVLRGTRAFWQHLGLKQPASLKTRQDHALQYAYGICGHPWLLMCDADELLYTRGKRFSTLLGDQPEGIVATAIPIAETVTTPRTPNEVFLRLPMTDDEIDLAFNSEVADALSPSEGRTGLSSMRYAVRTGLKEMSVRKQTPRLPGRKRVVTQEFGWADGAIMQHFIAESFDLWRGKLETRLSHAVFTPGIQRLLAKELATGDEAGVMALYRELYEVPMRKRTQLMKRGILVAPGVAPDHAVATYFK
jgi:hypothetical protein